MRQKTLRTSLATGLLLALASVAACTGGGSDGGGDALASRSGMADDSGGAADERASGDTDSPQAPGANRAVVRGKAVVKTGQVALTSKDLEKTLTEVEQLLFAVDGTIDREETSNDRKGKVERSTLVLRVPVDKFEAAMDALEKLGKLEMSDKKSKDVTTEVIDVDERVETLQNSLDQLQKYQRAAGDINDLLRFEQEITARQSELQSLQAQQSYLADQTSMSTITVYLSLPEKYVPPPDALEDAGFLTGLKSGWNALVDLVVVGLTVFGALLPFLGVGLLFGLPTWLLVRTWLRRRQPVVAAEAPAES